MDADDLGCAPAPSVADAVWRELETIPGAQTSALGASALALAREMDSRNSATSKSMCARALNETLAQVRALAPEPERMDGVDDLNARREARRSRGSAA